MKRNLLLLLLLILILFGCTQNDDACLDDESNENNNQEEIVDTTYFSYWNQEYEDSNISYNDLVNARVFYGGEYLNKVETLKKRVDIKYEFYTKDSLRFVNSSDGYVITIPNNEVNIDYSLSDYRLQFSYLDTVLTASFEDESPYGNDKFGWEIYLTEWLDRYIRNNKYLEQNNLSYVNDPIDSYEILDGYQVIKYSILINDNNEIAMPYYNIAIIRKIDVFNEFTLLVSKSKHNTESEFYNIIKSFKNINQFGISRNHQKQYELIENPKWSVETKAYYDKLNKQSTFDFGFFNYSLNDDNYDYIDQKLSNEINRIEELTDYKQKILPTYNHLIISGEIMNFPLKLATKYAGGNGFDDKAALQFTLQYTTNNNNVNTINTTDNYTPMFDILRGKYDEQFYKLANDIKSYKKPVLFRLNNEMNSDWTSYCGLITLLDPDIFKLTWIRLYDIFEEVGVDNCIWIYNPIAVTCPYSNWGEDLCYMPGVSYVQALGITRYEMMNDDTITKSFREGYHELYLKNCNYWMNFPWIISEFGCASGGQTTGQLYRNSDAQAEWVTEMFECLLNKDKNPFCSKISAAVWFNCNDVVDGKIENALKLESIPNKKTFDALKEGLKNFE